MKKIINLEYARRIASRRLPKFIFDFVDGAADDEITARRNRSAFNNIRLNHRVLVDVTNRDTSTTVLGESVDLPVLLAPAGAAARLICREGEIAVAKAAGRGGTIYALASESNFSLEKVASVATGPLWFQLYPCAIREDTLKLLERAHDSGYKALCISVDVPAPGKRERDIANKVDVPPQVTWNKLMNILFRPFWLKEYLLGPQLTRGNMVDLASFYGMSRKQLLASIKETGPANPSLTWDDLAWMRDIWRGPIVIKGVLNADDARRAIDYGVNGIIVSNHGGRQLDGQPATIEVLPEIIASVNGRAEVFIDSGIRRGTDVIKAIAMGARACLIGRPYLFSLAVGGEEGILQMLQVLKDEIDRTLALLGCRSLSDLNSEFIGGLASCV